MNKDKIYIGNILIKRNGETKLYQRRSQLLSLGNGSYVNLDLIRTELDKLKLLKVLLTKKPIKEIVVYDNSEHDMYVDKSSLVKYLDMKKKFKNDYALYNIVDSDIKTR